MTISVSRQRQQQTHRELRAIFAMWFVSGMLLVTCGCGSDRIPTYPVRGTVVFSDGSPVRTGIVEFSSENHDLTATGTIQPDGSFVLGTYDINDGAVAGIHSVIVLQMIINDGTVVHTKDHGQPLDSKFASYESSGLKASVVAGQENALEIKVTAVEK